MDGNRPILELVGEAKAEVELQEEEIDEIEIKVRPPSNVVLVYIVCDVTWYCCCDCRTVFAKSSIRNRSTLTWTRSAYQTNRKSPSAPNLTPLKYVLLTHASWVWLFTTLWFTGLSIHQFHLQIL